MLGFLPVFFAHQSITRLSKKSICILIFWLLPFGHSLFPQEKAHELNGYLQTRLMYNNTGEAGFLIRRAKLWITGTTPGAKNITYKLQGIYRSLIDENFYFQDAYADIHLSESFFRIGKFVPNFLFERMQSDAIIPTLERAGVINNLVHGTSSSARQIGIEANLIDSYNKYHLSIGFFNANQKFPGANQDKNILFTSKAWIDNKLFDQVTVNTGFSAAYRYLTNQKQPSIFPKDSVINGDDFRWGIHLSAQTERISIQGEYVEAIIRHSTANGYYIYLTYNLPFSLQALASFEKYTDMNVNTDDAGWYIAGLNMYLMSGQRLTAEFMARKGSAPYNYILQAQYQVFFDILS